MRRHRGECILVTLALMGCMFVIIVLLGVAGYAYYRKMSEPQVRPMPHQTPTRQVTLSGPTGPSQPPTSQVMPSPASPDENLTPNPSPAGAPPSREPFFNSPTPAPKVEEEPHIVGDGLSLGMPLSQVQKVTGKLSKVTQPSKNPWKALEFLPPGGSPRLFFVDGLLIAADDVQCVEFLGQSLHRGDPIQLVRLRSLFQTRLETQKTEIAGGVRHNFPMGRLEVQVWVDQGRCRRLTLARRPGSKSTH